MLWGALAPLSVSAALVAVDPVMNASGVPTSKAVRFTFDTPMNPDRTEAVFYQPPFTQLPATGAWTFGYTVLTCTPSPSWPGGTMVAWSLDGIDFFDEETVSEDGFFTTSGSGGGGDGHGTNAITGLVIQAVHFYVQTNATEPVIDSELGYTFSAIVSLSSNRTATAVTLDLPTGGYLDLVQNMFFLEDYFAQDFTNSVAGFNAAYPGETYTYSIYGTPSDLVVPLSLSPPAQQPNPPHISNLADAQAINPTQAFTLNWDAFLNGAATNYISVEIDDVFSSPDPTEPGALTGTARSVVIPADTLQPNTTYEGSVTFHRVTSTTNATHWTASVRATHTEFTLRTGDGSVPSGPISFTNSVVSLDGTFSCQIQASPGQSVSILRSTTLLPGSWSPVLTTSSETGVIEFTDGPIAANPHRFYRAQRGN